jgi:predicted ATPase/DNA-binding winged helix-turn-helix (wHTH) protein
VATTYYAGDVEVRAQERRVLVAGRPTALGARAFDLLMALIERSDRVVGKDELMAAVWPSLVVEENNLTVQISAVRKALGPGSIATVAGRGYRLALPLEAHTTGLPRLRHNLPAERSSFIGRDLQIAAVRQGLADGRLVTLTGIGGVGKTRLAIKVAEQELARFRDGAFFVDLAPLTRPEAVVEAVAQACGVTMGDAPSPSLGSPAQRLVTAMTARNCLLVMDNCEHLMDACGDLVDALLARCPELRVLATSREALALEGEQVLTTPPLTLPADGRDDEVTDAMRLFAERASSVRSGFALDERTRSAVAEICRRLDGIPLAIEFAAARVAHLAPADIAGRLNDRLRLLGGGRGRLGRQQTLAATLDWSHDLLTAPEQMAFRRLSVCAGSFTLGMAERIIAGDGLAPVAVLDLLASLAAKSLIAASADSRGFTRYRLLETVRLYAAEKLETAGEVAAVRARYRDAWLSWLEAIPLERLMLDIDAIGGVAMEIDHLRAAADACVTDDLPQPLARLASRLLGFCLTGNWYRSASQFLGVALREPERLDVAERVAAHAALIPLHLLANELAPATQHAGLAEAAAGERVGAFEVLGLAYKGFARSMAASMPDAELDGLAASRRDILRAVERLAGLDPAWSAYVFNIAADLEINLGDHEQAGRWAEAAVESCRLADGRLWVLGSVLTKLTVARHLLGRTEAALAAGLRGYAELRIPAFAAQAMADGWTVELAPALFVGGRRALAAEILTAAAVAMRRNGVDLAPNQFLGVAAIVEHLRGEPRRAARLMAAARSAGGADRDIMGFRTPASMSLYRHYMPRVRAALDPQLARALREEGRAMSLDDAFADAQAGIAAI